MHPFARQDKQTEQQVLFLPSVFNETLTLLFDAHHYFQSRGAEEQSTITPEQRPIYAAEMSRITMRLTSVMAWIMVRKAVFSGKIDENQAGDKYRLDAVEFCLAPKPEGIDYLPYYINYLSDRSRDLFARVARLDTQAYGRKH
jgi:regulator of CtrA degradation